MKNIKAVALDIDGTLLHNGKPLAGAVSALAHLRGKGLQLCFLTNMTARTAGQIAAWLNSMGFDINEQEVQTSVSVCRRLLEQQSATCFLALPDTTRSQFTGLDIDEHKPDYVVLGDLGEGFTYPLLNTIFNLLENGARLMVFHKNLYFFSGGKTFLDSGAFTLGLEAASGQPALVTGKPSVHFYESALSMLGVAKKEVVFVGDDISTDIIGAHKFGARSILVKTGKFKPIDLTNNPVQPDVVLEGIGDIVTLF